MTTRTAHTGLLFEPAEQEFEQIVLCSDRRVGLKSVIAIHDTTLGPSLGGIRMRRYPSHGAAVADALALARAMTYKAALANLPLGGGKSVINADPRCAHRVDLLIAHAHYISTLGGRYIPAVDMGTTVRDMGVVGRYVPVSSARRIDPGYFTARGVVRSIEAGLMHLTGNSVAGRRVAIQGLGSVGFQVAKMLIAAGADVVAADVDEDKLTRAREELGVVSMALGDILHADVDVLAPCAGGGVIDSRVVGALRAKVVVGAANNVLASDAVALELAARRIVHVPDFVANAGGLMAVEAELRDDTSGLNTKVDSIGATATTILDRAASAGTDTVSVALELARARVEARRSNQPYFASTVAAGV